MESPRLSDRAIAGLLALFAFGIAAWITAHHPQPSIDDSFYYFKIAQNLAAGNGSAFDGIHPTNGYHPLWLGWLVVIYWLTPTPETAALFARVLQGIFFAISAALVYATAHNLFGRRAGILTTLFWILLVFRETLDGLEYSNHALGLIATAFLYQRWFLQSRPANWKYLALGAILAATFLARLESLFLALCVGIFLLAMEFRGGFNRQSVQRLFSFAFPVFAVAGIYGLINWAVFGVPVPVSGIAKRLWSDYYVVHNPAFASGGWLGVKLNLLLVPFQAILSLNHISWLIFPVSLVVGVYGVPLVLIFESRFAHARSTNLGFSALAPFVPYSALNFFSYIFYYQDWVAYTPWYFVAQPWLTALTLGVMFEYFFVTGIKAATARIPSIVSATASMGLILYVLWSISFPFATPMTTQDDPLERAAHWLAANTPRDSTIAAWNAGILGYYSQRRVINLDGLVNSWDYLAREQYDLCAYWQKNGVAFIADYFQEDQAGSPIPAYPFYKKCTDHMELIWSDEDSSKPRRVKIFRLLSR